jgi:hypothetical protein
MHQIEKSEYEKSSKPGCIDPERRIAGLTSYIFTRGQLRHQKPSEIFPISLK